MLELKNVTKIYKNKVGTDVLALDDISLKFPDKGMVFLLGKSGSGKSTLLNVIGGLDVPSKGEIIVKGRSSKDFTNSDFDSYRNTYVGFVFQEYNVLDEFSTYENIALAIELQDKRVDEKKVKEIITQMTRLHNELLEVTATLEEKNLVQTVLSTYGGRFTSVFSLAYEVDLTNAENLLKDYQIKRLIIFMNPNFCFQYFCFCKKLLTISGKIKNGQKK